METYKFENTLCGIAYNLLDSYGLIRDALLKDDLIQEMRIRIMSMEKGQKDGYYLKSAKWAAKQFIYFWRQKFRVTSASNIDADFDLEYFHFKNGSCWDYNYGKNKNGENSSRAKLKNEQITSIRLEYHLSGKTIDYLAEKYGIARSSISKIVRNESYTKHNDKKIITRNGKKKLTDETIRYIRMSIDPHRVLARKFKVSESAIRQVRKYKTYTDIKP